MAPVDGPKGSAAPETSALAEQPPPDAALDALATRYRLDSGQRLQLAQILATLAADDRAPTTVRDPAAAADLHLADSLVALEVEGARAALTIADLGAGAGFPGFAMAVALPASHVRLVESSSRKCAFLRRTAQAAAITNAIVCCGRAEEWREGLGAHDLVTARALGPAATVAEYAAPLLRHRGMLIDWRGRRDAEEECRAAEAAEMLGLELVEVRRVKPFRSALHRHLYLYLKVRETPDRFPRKAGIARKRPLAGSPRA